jgi:ABC-2 type transport system ATP-binding protein
MQGEKDTLFNLNEAVSTYLALREQHTPVKMVWQSWGHSSSTPAPGELDLGNPDPATQYETGRVFAWFERYLRDQPVDTGPPFAYFRDWVSYTGNAAPAYASSGNYPVGQSTNLYLSGTRLAPSAPLVANGTQSFWTAPAGAPTNLTPFESISYFAKVPVPEADLPGTTATWNSDPLASNVDVVGSPRLTVRITSLTAALTQALGPAGQLVVFVRMQDVAPDGTASDINMLTAPVRVPDVTQPVTVTLPAFVHRFAPGHRIRLVVAASSLNYRGGLGANLVSITSGPGQVLSLPVV